MNSPMAMKGDQATLAWAEGVFGRVFHDPSLVIRALTHRSLSTRNFERLEFLGDRLLGAIIAAWLYEAFPSESEGKLTRRFARLVSRETCAAIARELGVPGQLRLGLQAVSDGGADSDNILGDAMEALIGALWLDAGDAPTVVFVRRAWASRMASDENAPKHPKSTLQEWAAARGESGPTYTLVRRTGPHHAPRFRVTLQVGSLPPVEADGASKQEAETLAARDFLARHVP